MVQVNKLSRLYFTGTDTEERTNRKLEPTAIFNLSLGEDKDTEHDSDFACNVINSSIDDFNKHRKNNDIVFETDSNTLYDLYQNLENIQEKLDELRQ